MSYFRFSSVACAFITLTLTGCSQQQIQQQAAQTQQAQSHVAWSGDVDNSATIFVQGGKTWVDNVTGKAVQNATSNFQGLLPSSDGVTVNLVSKQGRGTVAIVQQPTKTDNYTAGVRIVDPEPGKDHYKFVLTW